MLFLGLTAFFLVGIVQATPITVSAREKDADKTESWTIHEMELNFMTEHTGFNGKFWPEYQFKDSTLGFVVCIRPSHGIPLVLDLNYPFHHGIVISLRLLLPFLPPFLFSMSRAS